MPTAIRDELVTDASAAVRMIFGLAPGLRGAIAKNHSIAPSNFPIECANALRKYVRANLLSPEQADSSLDDIMSLPITLVSAPNLARVSLATALELGLSAYDAAYVVVARGAGARLITADRRLAAAYPHAELIA